MARAHPPTLISVIVPARDASETIAAQLAAVSAQPPGVAWEIVVVDNRSVDGTGRIAGTTDPGTAVRVVPAATGDGPGYARNVGARSAAGDLLVFCDADDVVAPGWLGALVRASERADAVAGRLEFDRLNRPPLLGMLGAPRPSACGSDGAGTAPTFGVAVNGGNFAVWRTAFEAVGGFDESFVGGSEDKDLGYRLAAAGFDVVVEPDAVVHVRLRDRLADRLRQSFGRGREDVHLAVRHRPTGYPRRGVLAGVRTLGGLLRDVARWGSAIERVWWWARCARLAGRVAGCVRYRAIWL